MNNYKRIAIVSNLALVTLLMFYNYVNYFDDSYLQKDEVDVISITNPSVTSEQLIQDIINISNETNSTIYYEATDYHTKTTSIYTTDLVEQAGYYTNVKSDTSNPDIQYINVSGLENIAFTVLINFQIK